ncbi:MAG: tetratricopeptide repeat protein [Capsulimonadaceae bacterium]
MQDWQLGLRAFREGRMREAADRLRAAAGDRERTVMQVVRFQTLAFLGAAMYALGYSHDAVDAFEDAVRLAPKPGAPADLSVNLANAYLAVGRRDEARTALLHALGTAPGHVEARMMLQRLESSPADEPIVGSVLGESPEGVKTYLRTLTFARVSSGGFDPAQVRQALAQLERYIDFLASQITQRDETIAKMDTDMERYRMMEDRYIQSMSEKSLHDDPLYRPPTPAGSPVQPSAPQGDDEPELTPIERLFRNKR